MRYKVSLFLSLIAAVSWAQLPNGRNHPELHWRKLKTTHFNILFHQGLDSLALNAALIAEDLYDPITTDLNGEPKGKTVIILSDVDDISNGIANPLDHTIFIWTQSDKKETTGSMHWLRRVIGHEFAHMVTFWGSRNVLGKPWELLTLGLTPTWFLEGVAQYESETWDAHRDLLLRTTVNDSALLPPRKLDGFVGADVIDSRLVYEEGHGLVRYIASKYGKDKIEELIRKHRKFPISFTWTMKRLLGTTTGNLFNEWKSETEETYKSVWQSKESANQIGVRINIPLQVVTGLRWSGDGQRIAAVGMDRWDEGIQRLYVIDDSKSDWTQLGGPHVGSYFSWSPDGENLVISRKNRGQHGSFIDDLFIFNIIHGKEVRITRNMRATDPAWSPIRDEICFVRRHPGGSKLCLLQLGSDKITPLTDKHGEDVFTPFWAPDGERIVFSFIDALGKRDIGIINRDGSQFARLTDDFIDDRTPSWSPDGQWIAFCSYQGGTPNLFKIRPDHSRKYRMTDVAGGVYNPTWTPDSKEIGCVFFERRDSVTAFTIPSDRRLDDSTKLVRPAWASIEPYDKNKVGHSRQDILPSTSSTYRSLAHLRPLITLPFAGRDDGGLQGGLIHIAADPLYKHQIQGIVTGGKRLDWSIEYLNGQLEPLIGLTFWGKTRDRGEFLIVDGPQLWERRIGAGLNISLPVNFGRTLLSNHIVQFNLDIERISDLYPDRFDKFRPVFRPFTGWINTVGFGYGWFWERPDVGVGVHPSTGMAFNTALLRADHILGSDLEWTSLSGNFSIRQELPWKRHVFGIRLGTLMQWGQQPIQDMLSLNLRGLSNSRGGDRFFHGTIEYRIPLIRDLGFRIPIFYFERFAWAFWMDWGKAWGSDLMTYETGLKRTFGDTTWLTTAGGELRCRIYLWGKLPIVVRGGYGWEITNGRNGDWYWLFGPVF